PESIAEFVITQALMLIRKVSDINKNTSEGDFRWQPSIRAGLLGELTVGIIGTGHIGRVAAKLFKGFGAKVIGYDLYPNDAAKEYLEYKDRKSTRLNSSHVSISYAVFCLKKK